MIHPMSPSDTTVLFRAIPLSLKFNKDEKRVIQEFATALSVEVAGGRSFECLVTNDRELRRLNSVFLQHDYATDVLSFPASSTSYILGELAVSVQRAEAQAQEFGHTRLDEVQILILHGLLHLTGLDHETDRGKMARAERKWRSKYGLPPTLIARAKFRVPDEVPVHRSTHKPDARVSR